MENTQETPSKKNTGFGCLIILAILFGIVYFMFSNSKDDTPLNTMIEYNGGKISVMNLDSFDYYKAKLIINSTYEYQIGTLSPTIVSSVGALQFADSKGIRFNPLTMKVQTVMLSCKDSDDKLRMAITEFR